MVGRLARGVSIEAARAELLARWPSVQAATLPEALPETERQALLRQRLTVAPLASGFSALRDRYGTTLWVLLALMGILLAVACANLAGLTLARSLTRRHQVAIRLALGGSARRVFWQLLVDGILLSTVAFAGALPLAWGIIRVVTASLVSPRGPARFPPVTPDAGVIAATALLTMGIGLAIGVVSAWQSVAVRVDEGLRPGRGVIGSLGPFGRGLLVAQVALTMTLLVGAGLFTTTLARLRANDTSLQSQRIVFTRAFRQPGDRELLPPGYYQALVTELARMPGADAAALSVYYPTYFGLKVAVPTDYHYTRADGVTPLDGTVLTDFVSPGFFDLFRFHLLKGRDVSWDDGLGKPAVALISASLARAVFPAGDEIGQHSEGCSVTVDLIPWEFHDAYSVAFSTRIGGVSEGDFSSLNLGILTEDDPARVVVNRTRLCDAVGADPTARRWRGSGTAHRDPRAAARHRHAGHGLRPLRRALERRARRAMLLLTADCMPIALARADGDAAGGRDPARGLARPARRASSRPACARSAAAPRRGDRPEHRAVLLRGGGGGRDAVPRGVRRRRRPRRQARPLDVRPSVRCAPPASSSVDRADLCTACHAELFFSHRRDHGRTGRQGVIAYVA